jgi:hypothetical protein
MADEGRLMLRAPDHYAGAGRGPGRVARGNHAGLAAPRPGRASDRRPPGAGDAAAGRFRALAEAYHVLSDPDRRAAYDRTLSPAARTRGRPDPVLLAGPPLRAGPVRIDGWPPAARQRDEREAGAAVAALEFLAREFLAGDFLAGERGLPW